MWRVPCLIALLLVSQTAAQSQDESDFVMQRPRSPDSETLVIGGRRVQDARRWPATFTFGKGDDEFCTATAIGPRVILTAAHCLPDGARGHVIVNDQRVELTCKHHPDYTPCPGRTDDPETCPANKTTSADYSLCLTDEELKVKSNERVNTDIKLAAGNKLILTGYGCNKDGGVDGGFGYLFEGDTEVESLPEQKERWLANYIISKGGAAICYGDSGGPSYKLLDAAGNSRRLIGVNSRSNMREDDRSFLSATALSSFTDWAENWADEMSTPGDAIQICGIHPEAMNCHP